MLLKEKSDGQRVYVKAGSAAGSVETSGLVEAAQAELKAAGGNIYALAGNNGGIVRATGTLFAADTVRLVGGQIDASGF